MALTCAAATLFTMAGCGNAEGTEGGAETMVSSTTADESGQITIEFSEHVADIQAQEPHLQKIITAFEESHPEAYFLLPVKSSVSYARTLLCP